MNDPATLAWLDQSDRDVTQIIRRHGWCIEHVGVGCSAPGCGCTGAGEDGPAFSYTVGLFGLGHPELLAFSLSPGTASVVLNHVAGLVRGGDDLVPGQVLATDTWPRRLHVDEVPDPGAIVFGANRFYQRPSAASVPVFQLTYTDDADRFPWETGYDTTIVQPRPGDFAA